MNFIPETRVRLHSNVPLSLDRNNQLWFDNITDQQAYFATNVKDSFTDFTYQRKERQYVTVPKNAELLYDCNYISFQNSNYSTKWFYGYITEIEYLNPNASRVYYEIDPFQTWLSGIKFKPCYVEREHVARYNADGTPIIHTIDEGLNYGEEYKIVQDKHYTNYGNTLFILVTAKDYLHKLPEGVERVFPENIGNVPQGFYNYIFPVSLDGYKNWEYGILSLMSWADFYNKINNDTNFVGKVVSLTLLDFVPFNVQIDNANARIISMDNVTAYNARADLGLTGSILYVTQGAFTDGRINCGNKYSGFPSYEESKLLMYPYSYTKITDMQGNEFDVKNEYINSQSLQLVIKGSVAPQVKTAYEIVGYKNNTNLLSGIINNNVSSMAIIDDYTAAYLQGNQNTMMTGASVGILNSFIGAIGELSHGNIAGAITGGGGIYDVLTLNAKMKDIDNHPSNLQNQGNNYNFDFANNYMGIRVIKYTVTDEYQKTLSDYFKMFGYKVNTVKRPNLHTRQNWNYVKTIDCLITGSMPQNDRQAIQDMFNKGITLWHTSDIGNYSLTNNEI